MHPFDNTGIFVGHGLSRDMSRLESARLSAAAFFDRDLARRLSRTGGVRAFSSAFSVGRNMPSV